jgi:hypothetical protein
MAVGMLTMLGKGISDELGAAVQKASRRSPADRPHRSSNSPTTTPSIHPNLRPRSMAEGLRPPTYQSTIPYVLRCGFLLRDATGGDGVGDR